MKKCELNKIKKGDKLSMTYYLTVDSVSVKEDLIEVTDQSGNSFGIVGKELIESSINSANQFDKIEKISRTELIEKLENIGDTVFTCKFNKLANEETVADALGKLSVTDLTNPSSLKKHLKDILTGEERVLTGYRLNSEPKLGRTKVVDLYAKDKQPRLIDHRSLEYIIVGNVKYVAK